MPKKNSERTFSISPRQRYSLRKHGIKVSAKITSKEALELVSMAQEILESEINQRKHHETEQ